MVGEQNWENNFSLELQRLGESNDGKTGRGSTGMGEWKKEGHRGRSPQKKTKPLPNIKEDLQREICHQPRLSQGLKEQRQERGPGERMLNEKKVVETSSRDPGSATTVHGGVVASLDL